VQSLAQPDTMRSAAIAAAITALACYPRLWLWTDRPNALWFMVTLLVLTSFVLWSFVFGWYPARAHHPVIHPALSQHDWLIACAMGLAGALVLAIAVDPKLKVLNPADYPESFHAWTAHALFSLSFSQLFLCYAPIALFLRLFRDPTLAILLTILLGEFLLGLQLNAASFQVDLPFRLLLFGLRALLGWASAYLFLRGGVLLGTTWSFLLECRMMFM
jgi:hypothetical protein